jgi:hypothetical protein
MSTKSYPIESWNPIGNNIVIQAGISIKPDMEFLKVASNNNKWKVSCKISGTHSEYDGCTYVGTVNSSGNYPNCRPNFFAQTGLYIITLCEYDKNSINRNKLYLSNTAYWSGYPQISNGKVEISEYKM